MIWNKLESGINLSKIDWQFAILRSLFTFLSKKLSLPFCPGKEQVKRNKENIRRIIVFILVCI
jgi:hypothetical protein